MSALESWPFHVGILPLYVVPFTTRGPERPLTIVAIISLGSAAATCGLPFRGGYALVPWPPDWWQVAHFAAKICPPLSAVGLGAAASCSVVTAAALFDHAERT